MKISKYYSVLLIVIASLLGQSCSNSNPTYLIGGSGWDTIAKVDSHGKILWSHKLEKKQECNSVTNLPNNKILYSFKKGFKVIDENFTTEWEYKCEKGAEIHSSSLTKQGNILIGECGNPAKIHEFSEEGEKLFELSFDTGVKNPHTQFRRVRKTDKNTYLVPVFGKKSILEIDREGKVINETKIDFFVFSIVVLENGNWLLSCGDDHKLVEFNPLTKEIVWELCDDDIEEFPLLFVAEACRLDNGNTIVCNWAGHSHEKGPKVQLFEIDNNKNVLWKIEDYQNLGHVSTIDPNINHEYLR